MKLGVERYSYYTNLPKKIPFPLICSDLSLTLKKVPFSENSWTSMLTHIGKVVPPRVIISHCVDIYPFFVYLVNKSYFTWVGVHENFSGQRGEAVEFLF